MNGYERYQLQCMIDTGFSLGDLMQELTDFQSQGDGTDAKPISEIFAAWEEDMRDAGGIWPTEDEWFKNGKSQDMSESFVWQRVMAEFGPGLKRLRSLVEEAGDLVEASKKKLKRHHSLFSSRAHIHCELESLSRITRCLEQYANLIAFTSARDILSRPVEYVSSSEQDGEIKP